MRINRFVALATGMSRRKADRVLLNNQLLINGKPAQTGDDVGLDDEITLNGRRLILPEQITIMLNKPVGYVVSRDGQGSKTIYDLLPSKYHSLKPVGRLDKDSSGLILLTNSGELANELTHPSFSHQKIYVITLNKPLSDSDIRKISETGVKLEDGVSRLSLKKLSDDRDWQIAMREGRNRQIRRTFGTLHYNVQYLKRVSFGSYNLDDLKDGEFIEVSSSNEVDKN